MSIAALFPGQGSQHIEMGKFLFENFKTAKELFEEAGDTLSQDFKKLCFEGPEEDLMLTENTQPALLLTSYATYKILKDETGFKPSLASGHSIGEYSALVSAGVFSFSEGMRAVRARGLAMQEAVPVGQGAMAAVMGLDSNQLDQLLQKTREQNKDWVIEAANFNAPGQIVVSGSKEAIEWAAQNIKGTDIDPSPRKLRLIPLKVSAPFHCSMMKPAEERMAQVLGEIAFKAPQFPVVQNLKATVATSPDEMRNFLISQVTGAVLWTQCVETLKVQGCQAFIECGPGKVLAGLVKKIDSDGLKTLNINSLDDLGAVQNFIKEEAG